jgi:hypothetical protein
VPQWDKQSIIDDSVLEVYLGGGRVVGVGAVQFSALNQYSGK